MTESLAGGASQVLDLLNYIEQVEKLKTKPAFSVPNEFFVAYQHELKGLPELNFNFQVGGDDVWLRVARLQEIGAPEPDEVLRPWVTLPKSPEKTPELKGEISILESKREVAREHFGDHPEVRELFDWYVEHQWERWAEAERPRRKTIARYNQLFSLQQAISSDGAETPLELAWGIGYASWKVALTAEDVAEYNLPSDMDAKPSSSNYQKFVERHGTTKAVELDAAPVKLLQSKLREAIESVLDVAEYNAQIEQEKPDSAHIVAHRQVVFDAIRDVP